MALTVRETPVPVAGQGPPQRGQPWRCKGRNCPQVLGEIVGATVIIRHSRRQIEARLPCAQVCDKCGTLNALDAPPERW